MELTNQQVKALQNSLNRIIQTIEDEITIINNEDISDEFLEPIMRFTAAFSDRVFMGSKDTINNI